MQSLLMRESMQRRAEEQPRQKGENIMKTILLWGSLRLILVDLLGHSVFYVQKYCLTTQ